jgi:hypothetical protein
MIKEMVCLGCDKQCKLGAEKERHGTKYTYYFLYPTIDNKRIDVYVDKSGIKCNAVTKLKEYEWNEDDDRVIWAPLPDSYLQDVLKEKRALARKISVLCYLFVIQFVI